MSDQLLTWHNATYSAYYSTWSKCWTMECEDVCV